MIYVFYFFAAILIWLSFKSFRGGIAYLKFFRSELEKPSSDYTPFATIIAPCRGTDEGLEQNLAVLFEQDYSNYEILFVVDDINDASVPIIKELSRGVETRAAGMPSSKLVVANKATISAQKIENLREAVLHADENSQVFVFVDSDARPAKNWLRNLIAPLTIQNIGASTGYRWFISPNPTFGSELRSAWNASIASALGPNIKSNFCWGGSTAIRRDVFERVGIRDKWTGTLSDDFTVTRALKEAGLRIVFVPQALTASVENCSLRQTLEFTTRQMKITRVYATPLWVVSFVGSGLFISVMIAAFLIVVFSRSHTVPAWGSLAVLLLVTFFSVGKSWLRLKAVKLVLTDHAAALGRQFWTQNTLWLLAPALFFYNSFAALLSRRMTWRGITYELKSPTETVIITD